jgi:hypothetical protein
VAAQAAAGKRTRTFSEKVPHHAPPLVHKPDDAAHSVIVLAVKLEVRRQGVDPFRHHRDCVQPGAQRSTQGEGVAREKRARQQGSQERRARTRGMDGALTATLSESFHAPCTSGEPVSDGERWYCRTAAEMRAALSWDCDALLSESAARTAGCRSG